MDYQQCQTQEQTSEVSSDVGDQECGTDFGSNASKQCAAGGAQAVGQLRNNLVADAIATIPPLCNVSEDLLCAAEEAVGRAAGAAFDAALEIAIREDPLGTCEEAPTCEEDGPEVSEEVLADAQARYDAGPGLAVLKFPDMLDEAIGESQPDGCEYSDAQVQEALELYATLTSRSLQAYGIQTNDNISLATGHSSGREDDATAADNIQDVVAGEDVDRSGYGNGPDGTVELSEEVLDALDSLAQEFEYHVSELAGGSHSRNSRHYAGIAIDVSRIDGAVANAANDSVDAFMERCEELGATEVLGPGDAGHDTHVHAAWPRP